MKIAIKAKFSLKFVILSQTDDSGSNWAKVDLISVLTSKNPDVFKCIPGVELSKIHLHCNIILSPPPGFSLMSIIGHFIVIQILIHGKMFF